MCFADKVIINRMFDADTLFCNFIGFVRFGCNVALMRMMITPRQIRNGF